MLFQFSHNSANPFNGSYFLPVIHLSFPESPDIYYLNKKVTIIGLIQEYKGTPEIIVKTPDQIKIGK